MKTLTAAQARQNFGNWLSRAIKGDDIGILYQGRIVALRPVEADGEDYAMKEYGLSKEELKRFARNINKVAKNEKFTKWDGTAKGLRG